MPLIVNGCDGRLPIRLGAKKVGYLFVYSEYEKY